MSFGIWQRTITDDEGNVLPGASIEVRAPSSNFTGALVSLFSNEAGSAGLANPFNADSEGFAQFYAAPRKVDIRATGAGSQRTWRDVEILGTMSTQNADGVVLSADATINSLTVGRGGGGGATNTANGRNALLNNSTGTANTANGRNALLNNTTGTDNTATGRNALLSNTTGSFNTANGRSALQDNTKGTNNTATGREALLDNTTGSFNTATGFRAIQNNTTGNNNAATGRQALQNNTTGSNNIGLGYNAGRSFSPFEVTDQDNRIVIGNNDHTDAYIRISFTVTSDARDKAEISPIPLGLDFVNQLEPTEYQFKAGGRDGEPDGRRRYGFLAQDVLAAEGADSVIVDNEDDENLKLHESYLLPVLVNAVKELTARIEELEKT